MRIVRTKSIPNVDDDRLVTDRARIHDDIHTPEGIHRHDGPRRQMIDHGIKVRKISAELARRGHAPAACRFCDARTGATS